MAACLFWKAFLIENEFKGSQCLLVLHAGRLSGVMGGFQCYWCHFCSHLGWFAYQTMKEGWHGSAAGWNGLLWWKRCVHCSQTFKRGDVFSLWGVKSLRNNSMISKINRTALFKQFFPISLVQIRQASLASLHHIPLRLSSILKMNTFRELCFKEASII